MTTGEKRAQLEKLGLPWPTCECHDYPMAWGRNMKCVDGGRFRCRVKQNETRRKQRQQKKKEGLCAQCDTPVHTATLCEFHAAYHADVMAQPYQRTMHSLHQIQYQARKAEMQATPEGTTAFVTLLKRRVT